MTKRFASILIAALAVSMTGCGMLKNREDRVVVVHDGGAASQATSSDSAEDAQLKQIKEFLDLYTDHGGMTREGLSNLLDKYKDKIGPFLAGLHMSSQDLVNLIFSFDANGDGRITPEEISNGLAARIPILRWIPDNQAAISRQELDEQIAHEYPHASANARAGLRDVMMRFDEPWTGGNGDGKLTRQEASGAGIIIGILEQTDFTHGISIPPGVFAPTGGSSSGPDISKIMGKMMQQKLDQQLFTRYPVHSSADLTQDDLKLEWMQLGLKFFLVDMLTHKFSPTGKLAAADQQRALSVWGIAQESHWAPLRKLYDNAVMGGDGDGAFNSLEAFNFLTDLEFACKARALLNDQFSAAAVTANPSRVYLLATLLKVFPRTAQGMFMGDLAAYRRDPWSVNPAYWDGFKANWDSPKRGGDSDGTIDDGEMAMALAYERIIENLYELYDTNHDSFLSRDEANPLFATLGITNSRIIDAFFANISLDDPDPSVWTRIRLFFTGDNGIDHLNPYDFQVRLVQILPRMLNGEHP